jgi:hypothetical protein
LPVPLSRSAPISGYLGHPGKHLACLTTSILQKASDARLLRFAERDALRITNSFFIRGTQSLA